ncbi:programmed cell death protein 2 [Cadophora sp. MPI-SDFR-AT-0126]|nr:programmed cell death protein 2 [Leotiomycetes sp. MPI-SDFR-AT-0126]
MAPYDSDSSGGEDDDYTETNVLLGYASKEASDDTISYLGGRPFSVLTSTLSRHGLTPLPPPSAALAKCKVCNDLMILLLQLNGDLPEHFPGHERRLYVLTCRRKTCRRKEGSVRVLRGVRISESANKKKDTKPADPKAEPQVAKPAVDLGAALFGGNPFSNSNPSPANPFSTNSSSGPSNPFSASSSTSSSNPFAAPGSAQISKPTEKPPSPTTDLPKTFASALSLNNSSSTPKFGPPPPPEPWPQETNLPPAYPLYFLADADYETLDKVEDLPIPTQTMDIDEGGSGSSNQKEDKDVYESTIDKTFQKFADRLAQNPEQVIRYEFKGQPLLYSKHDAVGKMLSGSGSGGKGNEKVVVGSVNGSGIPRCVNCGAGRVFEVQLTPHAIMELEREEMSLDGMEWGTIIVGVCEKDCQQRGVDVGSVGYVEEWAGVQWEELSERR